MSASSETTAYKIVRSYVTFVFEPLWVLGAFVIAGLAFGATVALLPGADAATETTLGQLFSGGLLYAFALMLVILPIWKARGRRYVAQVLGVSKKPGMNLIWLPAILWVAYMATTIIVSALATLLPFVDPEQVQDVGFDSISAPYEYVLAFLALVVLPPVAEELLFRGYLFGRVRERFGFWVTTILISATFGLVHLQWNVGIDVAVLSIYLCYLREKTGSVWASMVLHAIKNGLAYFLLFIAPLLGWQLVE